jgi:hypothetical protein
MDIGIGTLGLLPKDFWELTFADLIRLTEAFYYKHHLDWDIARHEMAFFRNSIPHFGSSPRTATKPKDIIKLPIDGYMSARKVSIEEFLEIAKTDMKHLKINPKDIG